MADGLQLKFLSLNARGLNNPVKRVAILDFLRKQGAHIVMLQETHIVRRDVNRLSTRFFRTQILLDKWSDNKGRITIDKIHIENTDIALESLYAPNTFDPHFYEQITKILLDLSDYKFITGAVFNAVVDHSLDRSGQSENKEQKQSSEALCSWSNNICIGFVGHGKPYLQRVYSSISESQILFTY